MSLNSPVVSVLFIETTTSALLEMSFFTDFYKGSLYN